LTEEGKSERSPAGKPDKLKKKTKRLSHGPLAHRMIISSDSENDFESFTKSMTSHKRTRSSSSSSDSSQINRGGRRKKKSHLLHTLSSGSDNEKTPQKMEVSTFQDISDRSTSLPNVGVSPGLSDHPIVYATPRSMSASSDSDEVSVLKRKTVKKGSNRLHGLSDSDEDDVVKVEETPKSKDVKKKTRTRKMEEISSGDDFEMRGTQLKRRRVTRALFSDSDSNSTKQSGGLDDSGGGADDSGEEAEREEEEEKSTPGRKRKKIRKLFTDEKLQSSTKEAQRLEKERIERLKKRQVVMKEKEDELVLEVDSVAKKPLIKVRQSLVKSIKPHQWEGIRFLYDACVEKLHMFKAGKTQSGAILAHCMGLGKTLQVIALLDALLMHEASGVNRVLILSPVNTIHNWRNEFDKWIPGIDCEYNIFLLVDTGMEARSRKLERWFTGGGVIFVGYDLFRNLVVGNRMKKKKKEAFMKYLLDPGPDIIVCDEGHVMRNASSKLSTVLQRVRTITRIILTGTPMQNNLIEYHTMVSFVKPNLLGTVKEFKNRFANPITNGQCRDSTSFDVRIMKQRAHILHDLLSGTVQRRDYRVLARFLPPKQEFVISIRLSSVQEKLYRRYLDKSSNQHTASDLFSTFSSLQKVWNHPWALKLDEDRKFEKEERRLLFVESDVDSFIVTGSEEEEEEEVEEVVRGRKKRKKKREIGLSDPADRPSSSNGPSRSLTPSLSRSTVSPESVHFNQPTSTTMLDSSDEDEIEFPLFSIKPDPDAPPTTYVTRSKKNASSKSPQPEYLAPGGKTGKHSRPSTPQTWYDDILTAECDGNIEMSGKMLFLLELLEEADKLKEKVLVFTQSLLTLDLIEDVLSRPENGDWTPGLDYYRLDGSTRSEMRTHQMTDFNEVENEQLRLFLISTRAGSLGVNLVAANRVVIFDACWNPSHDLQAVFRSYRFGQTKPIFVYRLLAKGTMEEKIYDRQVTKESLAMRVVDEKQIGRHYNASDLAELFTYTPAPPPPPQDERSAFQKPEADNVLQSILDRLYPDWVANYHEHDSLLEHVFSEELSEEDRKAAWDEYRDQMTKESTNYYNYHSLQNQLATVHGPLQTATLAPQLGQDVKPDAGVQSHQSTELLALLSNTNRSVKNLINLLDSKVVLRSMLGDYQRRLVPVPHNVTTKVMENGKLITEHYALVEEGVKRVNATLQKCHTGEIYLEPGANHLANEVRSQLIRNLDILRSGSKQPAMLASSIAGPSAHAGAVSQQQAAFIQHAQRMAQARAQQTAQAQLTARAQQTAILLQHQRQQQTQAGRK
jgi:transcriptional regulator ATRX